MGNHEKLLLEVAGQKQQFYENWLELGGGTTLRSFRCPTPEHIPACYLAFLRSCCRSYETPGHLLVHANYLPHLPLEAQPSYVLRWESLQRPGAGPASFRQDRRRGPRRAKDGGDSRPGLSGLPGHLLLRRRLAECHGSGYPRDLAEQSAGPGAAPPNWRPASHGEPVRVGSVGKAGLSAAPANTASAHVAARRKTVVVGAPRVANNALPAPHRPRPTRPRSRTLRPHYPRRMPSPAASPSQPRRPQPRRPRPQAAPPSPVSPAAGVTDTAATTADTTPLFSEASAAAIPADATAPAADAACDDAAVQQADAPAAATRAFPTAIGIDEVVPTTVGAATPSEGSSTAVAPLIPSWRPPRLPEIPLPARPRLRSLRMQQWRPSIEP